MAILTTLATTVIPAILPAAIDGIRAFINKKAGGAQKEPNNFQEEIEARKLDIEKLKTLAELDKHNNAQMPWWVDAIKTLQRPFFGVAILSTYIGCVIANADITTLNSLGQYVSMFGFYLFGERAYMYHQKRASQ